MLLPQGAPVGGRRAEPLTMPALPRRRRMATLGARSPTCRGSRSLPPPRPAGISRAHPGRAASCSRCGRFPSEWSGWRLLRPLESCPGGMTAVDPESWRAAANCRRGDPHGTCPACWQVPETQGRLLRAGRPNPITDFTAASLARGGRISTTMVRSWRRSRAASPATDARRGRLFRVRKRTPTPAGRFGRWRALSGRSRLLSARWS